MHALERVVLGVDLNEEPKPKVFGSGIQRILQQEENGDWTCWEWEDKISVRVYVVSLTTFIGQLEVKAPGSSEFVMHYTCDSPSFEYVLARLEEVALIEFPELHQILYPGKSALERINC